MTRALVITTVAIVAILCRCTPGNAQTPDELSITPSRVVFSEGARVTETVMLKNRGSDTLYYELLITNYRMTDTGTFEELSEPDSGQFFADPFIRFAPREVILPPNGSVPVKISCLRANDLATGEYRSHLVIRLARRRGGGGSSASDDDPEYGVAVPLIVRQGVLTSSIIIPYLTIDLLPADQQRSVTAVATTRLERSGTSSTYGDVSIWYVKEGGAPVLVGTARGVALYTPNRWRILRIPLQLPEGARLEAGLLRLEYRDRSGPEGLLLARIEVPVD